METSLRELMAEKLGGGKGKKKAKLHMHIHKMDDGKFMVEHQMRGGSEPEESKEHAPADLKALHDHIDQHYGPAESTDSAAASPTPTPVPAPEPQGV